MTFQTRPLAPEDLPTICAFPQSQEELFFLFPRGRYPLTPDQLAEAVAPRRDATVVTEAGRVLAFADFYRWAPGGDWAVGHVVVAPDARGRGVGRYLMAAMGERARAGHQARALTVSCFQGNGAGLLFYHHLGFVPYGLEERQDWFGYPMALIHLRLNL